MKKLSLTFLTCLMALVSPSAGLSDEVRMFIQLPTVSELRESLSPEQVKKDSDTIESKLNTEDLENFPRSIGMLINFKLNTSVVLEKSFPYLNQLGKLLQEDTTLTLLIEGHTDASGEAQYNMKLSKKRAQAVLIYLTTVYKINANRLKFVGKGESELLLSDFPEAPENRRVQFSRID